MLRQNSFMAARALLLATAAFSATAAFAARGDGLPYVTVTLDGFERAKIHKRAVALMRTEVVYDDEGNWVSSDTDAYHFDNLQVRRLTTDGNAEATKAAFSLKSSSRYVGWAAYSATGWDIMAYDLKRKRVVNVSNTPLRDEDPFFDLEDNRFAWKVVDFDEQPVEYDFVVSNGRKSTTVNEVANDAYYLVLGDAQTSGGNAVFVASGQDPEDGSFDDEVFFWDGRRLRQVTDDPGVGATGPGYADDLALVSGDQVVFVTTNPIDDTEPYQLRVYDGKKKKIRTVLSGGTTIVGGHVLDDDFCFPIELSDGLLIWNGSIVGSGPLFLLTDVRTGETRALDDVTGGSVFVAGTADGYVGMFSEAATGETQVMVYRPATGSLTTAATHLNFAHSGLLSISGPNLAYNYFVGDVPKVAIHYRSDEYAKEERRS
jgi:hypothetical protein